MTESKENAEAHWEMKCPLCGKVLVKPHPDDLWQCWNCSWGKEEKRDDVG